MEYEIKTGPLYEVLDAMPGHSFDAVFTPIGYPKWQPTETARLERIARISSALHRITSGPVVAFYVDDARLPRWIEAFEKTGRKVAVTNYQTHIATFPVLVACRDSLPTLPSNHITHTTLGSVASAVLRMPLLAGANRLISTYSHPELTRAALHDGRHLTLIAETEIIAQDYIITINGTDAQRARADKYQRIINLYLQGVPKEDISEQLGCDYDHINKVLQFTPRRKAAKAAT